MDLTQQLQLLLASLGPWGNLAAIVLPVLLMYLRNRNKQPGPTPTPDPVPSPVPGPSPTPVLDLLKVLLANLLAPRPSLNIPAADIDHEKLIRVVAAAKAELDKK